LIRAVEFKMTVIVFLWFIGKTMEKAQISNDDKSDTDNNRGNILYRDILGYA